ncbi:MAG: hypothetical protein RIQ93_700 [Verrucomicrobiota bacterium]|jgi:2-amino-4-hydroxy-6-hydroxymethyldihydropteridine diphosphokinase
MKPRARQAFIGAGANVGDRAATLRAAIKHLGGHAGITALETSPVYETEPVGPIDQPNFLNLVVGVETSLEPEALLTLLLEIEQSFGRIRAERWGPRVLDLDLLAFENETRATPQLELPHPRLLARLFVTVPLRDLMMRPRFDRLVWADLRKALAALPVPSAGWRPWASDFTA